MSSVNGYATRFVCLEFRVYAVLARLKTELQTAAATDLRIFRPPSRRWPQNGRPPARRACSPGLRPHSGLSLVTYHLSLSVFPTCLSGPLPLQW